MLLFQKRFHEGLLDGSITLTFRAWQKMLVKPGGRYRCHPLGVLEVDEVTLVRFGAIDDDDARRAGFTDRVELGSYIATRAAPDDDLQLVRVRLHHGGDGDRVPLALIAELTDGERAAIAQALARLDQRGDAPWTSKTLQLIGKHPRSAASKLAAMVRRDTASFKADVVKLKKLGLTQSFEVGYEVSPRGVAFLDGLKKKSKKK